MSLEWILFVAACLSTVGTVAWAHRDAGRGRGGRILGPTGLVLGAALFSGGVAWWWQGGRNASRAAEAAFAPKLPRQVAHAGYVSSDQCAACHPGPHQSWHDSFHRRMTQRVEPDTMLGDFENREFTVDGHRIRLERRGSEYWVEMVDPDWTHDQARARAGWAGFQLQDPGQAPRVWKRIGLATGSHNFQTYWVPGRHGNLQFALPLAWLVEERRWIPRKDTFIRDPHASSPNQIWNLNCIQCHVTGGVPGRDPRSGLLDSRVSDLGISCEACHGPGEAHVRANRSPLRRYLRQIGGPSPDPTIVNPSRLPPKASTQVCGQCHGMKFVHGFDDYLRAGFSYRPGGELEPSTPLLRHPRFGDPQGIPTEILGNQEFLANIFWPDGMIRVTGREYSGLRESACHLKGGMTCLSCHSMHDAPPDDQLRRDLPGDRSCLQCHPAIGSDLAAHTHHAPDSSGSRCVNCHMPHATYGLLKAVRNHYIDSPSARSTLETGRPNACNLCHLDQTLEWTARHLASWTGRPAPALPPEHRSVSLSALLMTRGDVAQRALVAANLGQPEARAVSGEATLVPHLLELLDDPYPAVREIAARSLRSFPAFREVPSEPMGEESSRLRFRSRVEALWKPGPPGPRAAAQLLAPDGRLDRKRHGELLRHRDHRVMDLIE
jgi:predicted CXXCH cytochrome family protein